MRAMSPREYEPWRKLISTELANLKEIGTYLTLIEEYSFPDAPLELRIDYLRELNHQVSESLERLGSRKEWAERLDTGTMLLFVLDSLTLPCAQAESDVEERQESVTQHPRTGQREMKTVLRVQEELEEVLNCNKVISERLAIQLRKIIREIDAGLKENDKIVRQEQKLKAREKEELKRQAEAELLRAKRNAAW